MFHEIVPPILDHEISRGEGEGEVAFFSAKRGARRNRTDLIESTAPCHDAQVAGPYWVSNPARLTVLAAKSEDYITIALHHNNFTLKPIFMIVSFLMNTSLKINLVVDSDFGQKG